jgi:DNA-binding PadR family transcriptional regulator
MSVRHALLGLLAQRSRHGYELHSAFEAVVGEQNWDVKPAQIYTTLTRLAESGLVEEESVAQEAGPEKRIYAITDSGRQALAEWFASSVEPEHQRDEFYIKLILSLFTVGADPYRVIWEQRARLYQEMHALTLQRTHLDPRRELSQILLLEKAHMHLEADVRWLDMVETRLDEMKNQPVPEPVPRKRGRPPKLTADTS